ncbi:reverse transcriptase domain-containing protein [Tanacetum coccineum]|uniref:Reverse transcriptase domain-containing protein n=1 Tax=Tanacetum coccineum TaxID=301880 RepID=A0ABQ4ZP18_9ASTR
MMAIFHDMIEKTMEVFMDDFSVFENSFRNCLSRVDKMLQRCEDTHLCLNWEKSHFMVKECIVLGHKISKKRIEVDKAKIDVIAKLPYPTTAKGVRSFLGHAGQRHERHFRPIHYASKTMNEAESHYTTTEKEMLAVVYVPDPMELEDHVPVYIPELELPEDLSCLPEDEAPNLYYHHLFYLHIVDPLVLGHRGILLTTPNLWLCEIGGEVCCGVLARQPRTTIEPTPRLLRGAIMTALEYKRVFRLVRTCLETDARRYEWQRQAADDLFLRTLVMIMTYYGSLLSIMGFSQLAGGKNWPPEEPQGQHGHIKNTKPQRETTTTTVSQLPNSSYDWMSRFQCALVARDALGFATDIHSFRKRGLSGDLNAWPESTYQDL